MKYPGRRIINHVDSCQVFFIASVTNQRVLLNDATSCTYMKVSMFIPTDHQSYAITLHYKYMKSETCLEEHLHETTCLKRPPFEPVT